MATTTRDLPLASRPTGVYGPFTKATPNGFSGFKAHIARCTSADLTIWPDLASRLKVMILRSYDGGTTFPNEPMGWEQGGGIIKDKFGAEIAFSDLSFGCNPEPTHVRITAEVINGPIRTFVDLTVP